MNDEGGRVQALHVRWAFLASLPIQEGEHNTERSQVLEGAADPLLAVDSDRTRCLLVPLDGPQALPAHASGAAVKISSPRLVINGRAGWYLRVACIEPALDDRFSRLVRDALEAVKDAPEAPGLATLRIVGQWQDLMRADSVRLSRESLAGLFGELLLLEDIVDAAPASDLDCWVGPEGQRHDFLRGAIAVEVKTTLRHAGRPASIHGIEQLEPQVPGGQLFMSWNRIEVGIGAGDTVGDVLARIAAKSPFSTTLTKKIDSMRIDVGHEAAQVRFVVRERHMFVVDGGFPRLTRAQLQTGREMPGVGAISYDVDLAIPGLEPLAASEVSSVISALGGLA